MSWVRYRPSRRKALVRLDAKIQKNVLMTSLDILNQRRFACLVLSRVGSLQLSLLLLLRFFGSLLLAIGSLLRVPQLLPQAL